MKMTHNVNTRQHPGAHFGARAAKTAAVVFLSATLMVSSCMTGEIDRLMTRRDQLNAATIALVKKWDGTLKAYDNAVEGTDSTPPTRPYIVGERERIDSVFMVKLNAVKKEMDSVDVKLRGFDAFGRPLADQP